MKKKYLLNCESFQIHEGNMWFVSGNFLCRRDIKTGDISLETCIIPQYGVEGSYLSSLTGRYENRMICIPEKIDRIVDYDIKTKEKKIVFLDNIKFDDSIKFRSSFFINDKIYIMPQSVLQIIIYDPKSGLVESLSEGIKDIFNDIKSDIGEKENLFSLSRQIDNKIYFSTTFSNKLCCFDPQKGNVNFVNVGPDDYKYQLFYYLDGIFYLIDNTKQRIVRWSETDGIIGKMDGISFSVRLPEESETAYGFFDAFSFDKVIYFPACLAKESMMLDIQSGQINICEALSNVYGCCFVGKNGKKEAILTSSIDNKIYIVNDELMINEIELELVETVERVGDVCCFDISSSENLRACKCIWNEDQEASLVGFIKYIC